MVGIFAFVNGAISIGLMAAVAAATQWSFAAAARRIKERLDRIGA